MNTIANTIFSPVKWVSHKIADGNEKAGNAKNFLSSMTSLCLFVIYTPRELAKQVERFQAVAILKDRIGPFQEFVNKINPLVQNALPSVKAVLGTLEVSKDYLTFLEFYGYVKDLDAPDLSQKTFAKKANLACKLGFSFIETAVLLPKKFNWYDLVSYSPVSFITSVTLKVGSSTLILASSLFAIWGYCQDKDKAENAIAKNQGRLQKLNVIKLAKGEEIVRVAVRAYFGNTENHDIKIKGKTDKLERLYGKLQQTESKKSELTNEINLLNIGQVDKSSELSEELERLKQNANILEEKIRRSVFLFKVGTGVDLTKNLVNEVQKKFILSKLSKMGKLQEPLTNITEDKSASDMFKILSTAKGNDDGDLKTQIQAIEDSANKLKQNIENVIDTRINGYSEEAVKHDVDAKIRKFSRDVNSSNAKVVKANKAQNYEISKIAIVASVTLGLLITHSMAPALLVAYATTIETATWYSGLAICITGLQRTIYETFYWKEPDQNACPTTNLRQFAAPAA